jgi:transposase InsO family protein
VAVESRTRLGDWEGDLITGRNNRSAIGTLVERQSRYLRLVHLAGGRTADDVRDALRAVLAEIPAAARLTLTWDQGSEMARHDEIAFLLADGVFFTYPGPPWQRGSNENANGLLRQYLPKRSDLSIYTRADLSAVEERLKQPTSKDPRLEDPCGDVRHCTTVLKDLGVATVVRIRRGTRPPQGGQFSAAVDTFKSIAAAGSLTSKAH